MKAMVLKQFGGVENFTVERISQPLVRAGEALVRIRAIGIDPIDYKTRRGEGMADCVRRERPMILGWDLSGEVVRVAANVVDLKIGDAVFGTICFPGPGSTYAQFASAPVSQLARKPENISHPEAAAATQSPLTAWQALVKNGNIRTGQRVLIHGGAGGVGSYAVQIARHIGCHVIATASGDDAEFVKGLGADEVIDYRTQRFETLAGEVDYILDTVGGENFVRSLDVLSPGGMIVLLPSAKKAEADKAAAERGITNYRHILMRSCGEDMRRIAAMLADGTLKAHVDRTYPFEQIPRAHEELEYGKVRGKIVVTTD